MNPPDSPLPPAPAGMPMEVRYSLPEMLREVALERGAPVFAMEKLDQTEITKLYKKTQRPRVLKSRK